MSLSRNVMPQAPNCPECRLLAQYPWQHEDECAEGVRQRMRWQERAIAVLIAVVVFEAGLFWVALQHLARCP
jgi:hypothetical protein